MKKLNLNILIYRLLLIVFLTSFSQVFFAQVIKTFTQRTSVNTPGKLIYNIKGDYTMIGNTNLTVVPYGDNTLNSNNPMAYVDVDSDPNTLNSSSATLQLSNENGADPNCSNIIYAGLYWTGRASNLSNSPESFNVTKGGVTKNYNKRTVSLKGPGETNYTQFVANPGNIFYPDGTYGNMYSAFVEVTNYVRATGIGEYTVADIALIEGNGGATGYYGGWGLIVIYENSKMNWRDVTVFDGHAYVTGGTSVNYQLPVSGFNTVQSGQVNMKLGMMAGEGDVGISGDYFRIRNWQDNAWVTLNHANNTSNNFFNSSINTGGNSRNPNLQNNTGLDIAMFNVPNVGNSVITNNQTSTTFQYGSTQDTYIIFCMAMSVDAYIPDVESLVSTEFINGIPVGSGNITGEPGDIINYSVQLKNLGTEPVDNLKITVPIPYSANYVLGSAIGTINFSPIPTPNTITLDPTIGANGSIVWDFGTLPLPPPGFPDSVLAELSFNLEITTDCNILTNPNCPPNVTLAGGYVTGIGSISGSRFILPFIQGYENAGPCLGEPITDPLIIDIDADAYVAVNCINTPTEREFLFCDYTIATIPVSEIAGDFPSGLRFFNTNNITPTSIEYDLNNPFPATPGTFTYFGIPEGVSMCYYTFTITVQGPMVANTTVTSNVSCIGESDGEILTTIIGGTSPYSFAWNGPIPFTSTNQNISALAAGTYNLIATDNIGCTDSSTVILTTIPDNTAPSFTCPSNIIVNNSPTFCFATVNYISPIAVDNCPGVVSSLTTGLTSGSNFSVGTHNVVYEAIDLAGNTATCSFTVTVNDVQLPTISCPSNIIATTDLNSCVANATSISLGSPITADNCGIASVTNNAPTSYPIGVTNVVWTVTDIHGNSQTCNQTVTISDSQNPAITCAVSGAQNVVTNTGVCTFTQSTNAWNASASDNCGVTSLTYTLTGATTGTGTSLNGVIFNIGTTNVLWTALDATGNTTTCSFTVVVTDNQNPVITCAVTTPQNVFTNSGICTYTHNTNVWNASATDNCGITSLTYSLTGATTGSGNTLNGQVFNIGTTTVTWLASDAAGNQVNCTFNVIVTDNQNPSLTCALTGSQNVVTNAGVCTYTQTTNGWNASATDNCGVTSLTYALTGATTGTGTDLTNVIFNLGSTIVTWTAADAQGNSVNCSFTVVVLDNQAPAITCAVTGAQNVIADANVCTFTQTSSVWDASASDFCGVTSLTYALSGATTGTGTSLAGVVFNPGSTTVTWTARDAANNSISCSFTVTVADSEAPAISCAVSGNQNVVADAGVCSFRQTSNAWNTSATDNCGVTSLTYTLTGATTGTGITLNGVVFGIGTTNVVWTALDAANNTTTCSFTVTVSDNQNPSVSCTVSGTQNVLTNTGVCSFTVSGNVWNATATDNCGVTSLNYTLTGATTGTGISLAGVSFNIGSTTVTWTALDAAGNTFSCSFIVEVTDNQNPSLTCAVTGTQNVVTNAGVCTYTQTTNGWNASATDNCGVTSLTYALTGATTGTGTDLTNVIFNLGSTIVTWTAADAQGNSVNCSFTVVVLDNQAPTITCAVTGAQHVIADANVCTFTQTSSTWDASASDFCGVTSLTYALTGATTGTGTSLAGVVFNPGSTTVTWTARDAANNSISCSFTVTVADSEAPVISCAVSGTQQVNVNTGICTFTQNTTLWNPTASDNCGTVTFSYILSGATSGSGTTLSGQVFNLGTTLVTWTVQDATGNTDVCSFSVEVSDNINPVIVSCGQGSQTVVTDFATCSYTQTGTAWNPIATDNCGNVNLSYVLTGATLGSGTSLENIVFNLGATIVTWTISDDNGNSVNCTYTITVTDNQLPSITSCGAIGNQNVVSDLNTCTYTQINNSWDATATDFCGVTSLTYQLSGATNGSGTSLVGVEFNIGITTVTWTARDAANNLTTCTFDVTVTDAEAPQIICGVSVDQNVITDNGVCSFTQTSTSWNASAGDNCSVASLTYSLSGATTGSGTSLFGVSFGIGTTNVVWTAMDAEGNTSSCSFEVLVQDTQAPAILTCGAPVNQTVNTNIGMCTFTQTNNGWNALATDNCGSVSLSYLLTGATSGSGSTLNGVSFNLGLTTVEWTATDNSNNTTTCTFTVTVLDNQVPVIINCQSNQVVSADNACEYELPDYTSLITFTDNCSATITQSPIAGTLVGLGVTSITITVTDQSGNATLCNFSITVNDTEAPVIADCPNNITMSNDAGNCGAFVTWTAPTATDNCSVSLSSTHASGDFFTVGSTIVSYTAIDPSGNQVTCSFTVSVNDTELPNLVCPTNIESCDSLVFFNDALASDNCGIQSIQLTSSLASGSLFPIGTTSVTFEAIDIHMNSTTCSFDVIINPTPVLSYTQTNVLCNGAANGSLTLNITNGTPLYNILWSNSETTTTITGLPPQDYTATVVDNNGCQAAITATITEPLALTALIEVTDVICFGENNGALEAIPSGGTLPYSFVWNNGTLTADNNNLTANDYDVTITDGNNCSITLQSEVTQPDSIVITTFINNATCLGDNGSIMTSVSGGTLPYSFDWSNGTFNQNLVNAISGVYTLTLTDFNGCTTLISDSVGTENNLTAIVRVSDVSCYGENNGYASVAVVTGNEPYQYIWSNGIETHENISISAGLYDVTIIDFYGCEITLPAIINQPDSLFITFDTPTHTNGFNVSTYGGTDGQISSIVNGGTLPYEYIWSNGETTSDLSQLTAGEYTLVVSDFNGCVAYNMATLNQPFVLEMPNGISPNNDGLNDFFVVRGLDAFSENEILIYNRWGNLVYERKNYDNTWAATNSKGEELPDATYFVILTVKTGSDDIVLTGYVDVRRK
jgi:gliding motility-associated-like protein